MSVIGVTGLMSLFSHVFFIALTWRVIQGINFDPLVRKHKVLEARIIIIFVTIAIGTTVSNFVIDIIRWSQDLIYLF